LSPCQEVEKKYGFDDRLVHRDRHVREGRADDDIDLVLAEILVRDLDADIGLLLVVLDQHLDRQAADLAAEILDREVDCIPRRRAVLRARPRQSGDDADLEVIGRLRVRHRQKHDGADRRGRTPAHESLPCRCGIGSRRARAVETRHSPAARSPGIRG
jgi:hypothetical protein